MTNDLQISISFQGEKLCLKTVFKAVTASVTAVFQTMTRVCSLVSVYSSGRVGAVVSGRIYGDQKNRPPDQENCIFCKFAIWAFINNQNWKFLLVDFN